MLLDFLGFFIEYPSWFTDVEPKDRIIFLVQSDLLYPFRRMGLLAPGHLSPTWCRNPWWLLSPARKFFLILNLAIGGHAGGQAEQGHHGERAMPSHRGFHWFRGMQRTLEYGSFHRLVYGSQSNIILEY